MKKLIVMLLAAMMVLSLAACGGSGSATTTAGGETTTAAGETTTAGGDETTAPAETTTAADETTHATGDISVDMSVYPTDLNAWTSDDFIDYFEKSGVFTERSGFETWYQDHETYWPGTPVSHFTGYWNEEGSVMITVGTLDATLADSSEDLVNEWLESIRTNKTLPGDYSALTVDHLVGNVFFTFETTVLDEEIYNQTLAAYEYLVEVLNLTPEF